MGDLQATVEFLVELYKFYNVDLFIRGYYQFRLTFKPPKTSHAIQVEICEGHGERGAFTLFPAFVTNDGQTAVSRTFNIYYKDEEVLLKDVFLFRVNLLIDSTKAADCIDKTALEMTVDVHFTDQVVRESDYRSLPLVTSRTLKFHFSCFNGLHHQVPLLFDYYYFSVLDLIVHANVVSLGLPNWSILKQVKTGWFSKSTTTPRSSTPLFYGTLFGNRSQLGSQFYSDPTLRYAVTNSSSISREHFEKAAAIHRNLCAILAMAHSQLLNYFDEMMQQYFDQKQRIKLGEKLDPADLVEGLCKKLETLQSCEQVFDEMCSDMSVLNNELALLWLQFQESFTLNEQILPVLRKQHHNERMMHFSEAFFVHELPWQSLLNATDSSLQKHLSMGQSVKSSRYLSMIPAVAVECAEVDGDSSSTPIFFEDLYVNRKETNVGNAHAVRIRRGSIEDDVLEHKPLSFGILNKAFNDISPQVTDSAGSSDFDHELDAKEVWVDIKTAGKNDVIVSRVAHAKHDESKISQSDDKGLEGIDSLIKGYNTVFQDLGNKPNTESSTCQDNTTSMNDETIDGNNISCQNNCLTETSQNIEPSALIDCKENSLENLIKNVETPLATNGNGDAQGSQEHCGTMMGTKDSEVMDVSDIIAIIDATAEEQPSMPGAAFLSMVDPSSRSQESGTLGKHVSSGDNEGCLGLSVVQNETTGTKTTGEKDLIESEVSTCLSPSTNLGTTVENLEAIKNDSPLESADEKVNKVSISGLHDLEEQNKVTTKNVSSSNIVAGCDVTKEADKKKSSVRYVGSSDTTAGNCSELERNSKNVSSISEPEASSKVAQADKSTGNDSTINRLPVRPDGATTLLNLVKITKTEATIKEAECGHLNNSSSEQHLKNTSDTNISSSSNPPPTGNTSEKSGSKTRNDAQAKRVSNSIFYEGVPIIDAEENCTGQGSENEGILHTSDTIRLSSNSSADVISCFCGAGILMNVSSPYRPTSESEGSNSRLQKAKQDVISRMNYCGTLYSEFNTDFLVKPYFINPKPDLAMEPIHFVVCVHGLEGNSGDLRLLRCFLEMALPSTKFEFLMSEVNQDNTFVTFEKLTEKLVSEILHNMEAYRISPTRISFIGHSLGNIIIRSALNHPLMEPYVELFHTFLSLSGPHLGMAYHTSSLVSTGMWLLQKWKKSDSLLQLSLNDSTDMRDTFIYKLSKKKGLEFFTNVLLVSSVQDHYVPFHSSRIELPKSLRSNSQECIVYREMMENLLTPLLNQPNRTLVRYSVYHCLPSSTNTFIGRAAHIAMLDSELFIEKLICTSAAKYFQ